MSNIEDSNRFKCFGKSSPHLENHFLSEKPMHSNSFSVQETYNEDTLIIKDRPSGRILNLFLTKSQPDLEVVVRETGETFQAHKLILSMTSPILAENISKQDGSSLYLDDSSDSVKWIMLHAYTDYADIPTDVPLAIELYEVLRKYKMNLMALKCSSILHKCLKADTIDSIYRIGCKYDDELILAGCMKMIETQGQELLKYAESGSISHDLLKKLIQHDSLAVAEIDIFKSVVSWAKNQDKLENSENVDIRDLLIDILPEIDFFNMTVDDIVQIVIEEAIFSDSEITGILLATERNSTNKNTVALKGSTDGNFGDNLNTYPSFLRQEPRNRKHLMKPNFNKRICHISSNSSCDFKENCVSGGTFVLMTIQTSQEISLHQIHSREECFLGRSYLDVVDNEIGIIYSSEIGPPWNFPAVILIRPNALYTAFVHIKGRMCKHNFKMYSVNHSNVEFCGEAVACDISVRFCA